MEEMTRKPLDLATSDNPYHVLCVCRDRRHGHDGAHANALGDHQLARPVL